MGRQYNVNEDVRAPKLPIWFVPNITNKITLIYEYNIDKQRENTERWIQDLETIKNHISERAIGFNYSIGRKSRWGVNQYILGHKISYSIKSGKHGNTYICVYRMSLNIENYGLIDPTNLSEGKSRKNVHYLNESQLRSIIQETIKKLLRA